MKTNDRRSFLKSSLLTAAGLPLLSSLRIPETEIKNDPQKELVYRTLGKTGLKVPVISMGTGDTENPKLVEAALQQGVVLLATSQYYGNGNNEKMLGEVLKNHRRDSFIIMTSAMPDGVDYKEGTYTAASTGESFLKKFEGSLQRLGVDHVDIMLLPFAAKRESVFFEPLLKAMEKIKKDGKAKFIGIATHKQEHVAIRAAVETKIYDIVLTAYNFRKDNINELKEAISFAANEGMGIIAMKTMAGAYWDKERTRPVNTRAALKWVLKNEHIHTTVPGFTTFEQLSQNIGLMKDLKLTDQEKKDLTVFQYDPKGIYCQQCGTCLGQCLQSLDIPTLMRSFMYAYGYKNLKHAQQTLSWAQVEDDFCKDCSNCTVHCPMGFDIKSKIADIVRLKNMPTEFLV